MMRWKWGERVRERERKERGRRVVREKERKEWVKHERWGDRNKGKGQRKRERKRRGKQQRRNGMTEARGEEMGIKRNNSKKEEK